MSAASVSSLEFQQMKRAIGELHVCPPPATVAAAARVAPRLNGTPRANLAVASEEAEGTIARVHQRATPARREQSREKWSPC
jgi:hypothetical protein